MLSPPVEERVEGELFVAPGVLRLGSVGAVARAGALEKWCGRRIPDAPAAEAILCDTHTIPVAAPAPRARPGP